MYSVSRQLQLPEPVRYSSTGRHSGFSPRCLERSAFSSALAVSSDVRHGIDRCTLALRITAASISIFLSLEAVLISRSTLLPTISSSRFERVAVADLADLGGRDAVLRSR